MGELVRRQESFASLFSELLDPARRIIAIGDEPLSPGPAEECLQRCQDLVCGYRRRADSGMQSGDVLPRHLIRLQCAKCRQNDPLEVAGDLAAR